MIGLGIALALGLLIGLEREWADDKPIGLASFGLIGLFGGMAAVFLDRAGGWPIVAGLLALGVLLAAKSRQASGITTLVAGLVAFLIGAAAVAGYWLHATVIAGAVTLTLHWKEPMHGMVARLGRNDLETIAWFVLITLVILPVLPDAAYGPYDVFNPFNTWLLVVLIVAINLAGYVTFRLLTHYARSSTPRFLHRSNGSRSAPAICAHESKRSTISSDGSVRSTTLGPGYIGADTRLLARSNAPSGSG